MTVIRTIALAALIIVGGAAAVIALLLGLMFVLSCAARVNPVAGFVLLILAAAFFNVAKGRRNGGWA